MIDGARVLGLVAARGGSKGIPRKNLRPLGGRPLIAWTAEAALASRGLDRVILSTEDDELAAAGRAAGLDVPFRRPAELATDTAGASDVILHALDEVGAGFEYVVYLQPTSPLRTAADIDACLDALVAARADRCVSVCAARERPEWMYRLGVTGAIEPVVGSFVNARRQDLPPTYVLNGAVYVTRVSAFRAAPTFLTPRTVAHVMSAEHSVDIDEPVDLVVAEALLAAR